MKSEKFLNTYILTTKKKGLSEQKKNETYKQVFTRDVTTSVVLKKEKTENKVNLVQNFNKKVHIQKPEIYKMILVKNLIKHTILTKNRISIVPSVICLNIINFIIKKKWEECIKP